MLVRLGILLVTFVALSVMALTRMTQMNDGTYIGPLPALTAEEEDLASELQGHVQYIALMIGQRNFSRFDSLGRTVDYIIGEVRRLGYKPQFQEFEVHGRTLTNIIVEVTGVASHREILVVGAHYDSYLRSPCANASASGTAALLELLKLFKNRPFPRTVRFVFFASGEKPWRGTPDMGSTRYAEQCKQRHENIVGMISLEALGHYSGNEGTQRFPFPLSKAYPTKGNFIGVFGPLSSRRLVESVIEEWTVSSTFPIEGGALPSWFPGVQESDHNSFASQGYPAVLVTDTGRNRYRDIRTNFDTFTRLDYERMARVIFGLKKVIENLGRVGA